MDIEKTVLEHYAEWVVGRGEPWTKRMAKALAEQAATHAIELRAYEATVANLEERIRQLEAERVPEGWKLVPIEPTAEQIFAMDSFSEMCFEQFGRDADTDEFYRAGIAAAPQQSGGAW